MPLQPKINVTRKRGRDKHGWTTVKPAKITIGLVKCGICHKTYNNPLTHTCSVNTMPQQKAQARGVRQRGRRLSVLPGQSMSGRHAGTRTASGNHAWLSGKVSRLALMLAMKMVLMLE